MPRTSQQKETTLPPGIDTLAWSQFLRDSGVPKSQAEAQVKLIAQAIGQSAASKADLKQVEFRLETKIDQVESRLKTKIDQVESRLETKIESLKVDVLRWMFGMFLAQTALILTVLRYFGQ